MKALSPWFIWPGENGIKIFSVVQNQIVAIVGGKSKAADVVPVLVKEVEAMLLFCKTAK